MPELLLYTLLRNDSVILAMLQLVYETWLLVSIWRCAPNCSHMAWRVLARLGVVFLPLIPLIPALITVHELLQLNGHGR